MSNEPIEWKSANWWRNRPVEDRLEWLHIPKRYVDAKARTPIDLSSFEPGDNYIIHGLARSGKTTTAVAALQSLVIDHSLTGRFVVADDYVEWIKDSFENDGLMPSEYSSPYLIKNIKAVFDVLVLDGLGEERDTPFARHELGTLLRKRYDDMRTTIITTSLTPDQIVKRYEARVAGAIESYETVIMGVRHRG